MQGAGAQPSQGKPYLARRSVKQTRDGNWHAGLVFGDQHPPRGKQGGRLGPHVTLRGHADPVRPLQRVRELGRPLRAALRGARGPALHSHSLPSCQVQSCFGRGATLWGGGGLSVVVAASSVGTEPPHF